MTVYTHAGLRVDFMSAVTNQVISTGTTDATGKIEAEIDYGDRAVIVTPMAIKVLDKLEPTKVYRYRWYSDGQYQSPLQPKVTVTASWSPPAGGASNYQVSSLCGDPPGYISATTTTKGLCSTGDGILVVAFDAQTQAIGSAYQIVSAPAPGPLAITAPFVAHRDLPITLAMPQVPGVDVVDISTNLYTAEGVWFQDEPFVSGSTNPATPTAKIPAIAGDVRSFVLVSVPGLGAKWLIDRRRHGWDRASVRDESCDLRRDDVDDDVDADRCGRADVGHDRLAGHECPIAGPHP